MAFENIQPKFFKNKSILRKWLYSIMFYDTRIASVIQAYHVVDINIPFYEFEATPTSYGSVTRSFTSLQKDRGLQFSITFEEDRFGNVTKLIHILQQTILNQNGVYNPLNQQIIGDIRAVILDDSLNEVMDFNFGNCRFMGAESFSLSYADSDSLKHKIDFVCDVSTYNYLGDSSKANGTEVPKMPVAPTDYYGKSLSSGYNLHGQQAAEMAANKAPTIAATNPTASVASKIAPNSPGYADTLKKAQSSTNNIVSKIVPTVAMEAASVSTAIPGVAKILGSGMAVVQKAENAERSMAGKAVGGIASALGGGQSSVAGIANGASSYANNAGKTISSTLGAGPSSVANIGNIAGSSISSVATTGTNSLKSGFSKISSFF